MAALHNSNNVVFMKAGGGSDVTISADYLTGQGVQETHAIKSLHYVNTPQAGPNGLIFEDADGNQVSAQVIPSGVGTGYLFANGPERSIYVRPAITTANETATSGCYWESSENNPFIYLTDLNDQGAPQQIYIPASVTTDIVYECNTTGYVTQGENVLFGLKETSGQDDADFLASSYINFAASANGNGGVNHQTCMLRIYNSQDSGFYVYPAFWKGYNGAGATGGGYSVDDDKFTFRYF